MAGIQTILHPTDSRITADPRSRRLALWPRLSGDFTGSACHDALVSPLMAEPPPEPLESPIPGNHWQLPWRSRPTRRFAWTSAGRRYPAEEILRLVESARCDLIVMGSHGRTGLERS